MCGGYDRGGISERRAYIREDYRQLSLMESGHFGEEG
jgi:hypothetical protein